MTLTFNEKYQAILNKDASYEGLFITAVKTTGIFCRPVCTARKPKIENVEFYNSIAEALEHGYRPCKVCRPLEPAGETPEELKTLLEYIENNPGVKLKDNDLQSKGLEPNAIRRWFKKNYGMTFHDYQRKMRLNFAHDHLSSGRSVTHTAYDLGFESISGFSDSIQRIFSTTPSNVPNRNILNLVRITTPLGPMVAGATGKGVCLLEFSDSPGLENHIAYLSENLSASPLPGYNSHLESLEQQLGDYFNRKCQEFKVELHPRGTKFQMAVWEALLSIPYGETQSYSQQAQLVGQPDAVRAVAAANGQNRIAIVVPCHRVIGKNGKLTGYAGGIHRKQYLLDLEQGVLGLPFAKKAGMQ